MARQVCVRLRIFKAKSRFIMKVLFTLLYVNLTNLKENDHNFVFLSIKYQLSNTLSQFCRETENSLTVDEPCFKNA